MSADGEQGGVIQAEKERREWQERLDWDGKAQHDQETYEDYFAALAKHPTSPDDAA